MRGHKRKFNPNVFVHVFQHALQYRVVFYSMEDRLVFYTIFSVIAWRYGVVVLALALMYNHFHCLIQATSSKVMALFIGTVTSVFASAFNRDIGRKGALFEKAYGNSLKWDAKSIRTSIAYNYNNSVEKGLFTRAEDDRWNFLAYVNSDHPFSSPIVLNKASKRLRGALKDVDAHVRDKAYLSYATVRRLFTGLSNAEREQLLDYTIARYFPIDKQQLVGFYKGYDEMILAINSNTGSEYDIKEEYTRDSDTIYSQMLDLVYKSSFSHKPHSIVSASLDKKKEVAMVLRRKTGAKEYQICRILHTDMCDL